MNNRVIVLLSVFFALTFFFQFIFIENGDGYLYTELQESHMQEAKYKRDDNFWMVRKTEEPLNGLVYDYSKNGQRIEFGYLVNGYQDGTWKFFHENGKPSMENIYKNGKFIETTQRWDSDGKLAKIFFTNGRLKHKIKNREFWGFTACREFKRAVAKSYPENWNNYIVVDQKQKIKLAYSKKVANEIRLKKQEHALDDYNEFDL